MSETIRGKLQEIIAVKTGKGKRGPWTLWAVKVGDEKYGTKFDKVKAAVGDTVEFEAEENENGYTDVLDGTFKVVKKATSEESAAVSKANAEDSGSRQNSIESQVALKEAVGLVIAFSNGGANYDVDEAILKVTKAYSAFSGCLHPASKAPVKAAAPKAKAKPAAEEESQDPDDDDGIPY